MEDGMDSATARSAKPYRPASARSVPCSRIGRKLLFNRLAVEQALAERAALGREVSYAE
jgi:hypothetical protein